MGGAANDRPRLTVFEIYMIRSVPVESRGVLSSADNVAVLSKNTPILFKGGCSGWSAFEKWDFDFFRNKYGSVKVPVSQYNKNGPEAEHERLHLSLSEVLASYESIVSDISKVEEAQDFYVAGWHYSRDIPELDDDIYMPEIFSDNVLPLVNDKVLKYDWKSLFIGSSVSHTPAHTDSFYVAVWLALLKGVKTIRYVPSKFHEAMKGSVDLFSVVNEKLFEERNIPIFEAIVEAGDIAYHPPGWWHQVRNNSDNIALSFNYVPPFFYLPFEQQLISKAVLPILVRLLELRGGLPAQENTEAIIHALESSSYTERSEKLELLFETVRLEIKNSRLSVDTEAS